MGNRENSRNWRIAHPEHLKNERERMRKWRITYPEKTLETKRKCYAAKPEKYLKARLEWQAANPEKHKRAARKWLSGHPAIGMMRKIVHRMIRATDLPKTSRTQQYIGCTPGFLRNHLEEQFKPGMSWENYGKIWHIDHIVPLSWWDLENHPEHLFEASHYSNLKPMFVVENRTKSARYCELIGV
jgi:hypothetical protein